MTLLALYQFYGFSQISVIVFNGELFDHVWINTIRYLILRHQMMEGELKLWVRDCTGTKFVGPLKSFMDVLSFGSLGAVYEIKPAQS